jgi:hypothetical protein
MDHEAPEASWKARGGALRLVVRPKAAGALRLAELEGAVTLLFFSSLISNFPPFFPLRDRRHSTAVIDLTTFG